MLQQDYTEENCSNQQTAAQLLQPTEKTWRSDPAAWRARLWQLPPLRQQPELQAPRQPLRAPNFNSLTQYLELI